MKRSQGQHSKPIHCARRSIVEQRPSHRVGSRSCHGHVRALKESEPRAKRPMSVIAATPALQRSERVNFAGTNNAQSSETTQIAPACRQLRVSQKLAYRIGAVALCRSLAPRPIWTRLPHPRSFIPAPGPRIGNGKPAGRNGGKARSGRSKRDHLNHARRSPPDGCTAQAVGPSSDRGCSAVGSSRPYAAEDNACARVSADRRIEPVEASPVNRIIITVAPAASLIMMPLRFSILRQGSGYSGISSNCTVLPQIAGQPCSLLPLSMMSGHYLLG
jgi:hypothetical protein